MRISSAGTRTKKAAPLACTHARGVHCAISHAPNAPCSVKHRHSQSPMYWNVAGNQALKGFKAKATSGMESVNPMAVPIGA